MLEPAYFYKDEIEKNFIKLQGTEEIMFYSGNYSGYIPEITKETCNQYAITEKGKLIGYFAYTFDVYSLCMKDFGLMAFDSNNKRIGLDVYKQIKKIIFEYNVHRIEYCMISGNPVEKHYDNFCKRFQGRKLVLKDAFKDEKGVYHDDVIYEILIPWDISSADRTLVF